MPPKVIPVSASLRLGVLNHFDELYRHKKPNVDAELAEQCKEIKISARTAEFPVKTATPVPVYWGFNQPRTHQTLEDKYLPCTYRNWDITIPWNRYDEGDDQLGDLRTHVEMSVDNFLDLPHDFMVDYLSATPTKLPSISNAIDGAALFSATDGAGSNRFGVSGGNIISSTGYTVASIQKDIWTILQRFRDFNNTNGRPFFGRKEVDQTKLLCWYPTQLAEPFEKIRDAKLEKTNPAVNTATSNILHEKIRVKNDPLLSTSSNDWYCQLIHPYHKPFGKVVRYDVTQQIADETNSDECREKGQRALYAECSQDMIPFSPYCIIKVSA